ncbi:MAG: hypothetical protein ACYC61_29125 [Isosphaeraceae bacterium]
MKTSLREWNNAIGRSVFSDRHAGQVVYLAIDSEELGRIGEGLGLATEVAYESFRAAVIDELRFGWPNPDHHQRADEYPPHLALIVAQVVAAFQMHDDEQATAKAYWRRLREFLGQSSEDRMPDGLDGRKHERLWRNLRCWANEKNRGQLGQLRLVEKRRGQRLVAEPLGQCLMRRGDLERLRELFREHGRPDPEPYQGRRLRDLVNGARASLPNRYFTRHSLRVFDDQDRYDAAWRQIEDDYDRFLREEYPGYAAPKHSRRARTQIKRRKTTILLEISRKGLSGGLYRRENDRLVPVIPDVGEILRRCFLRFGLEGPKPPYKPLHDNRLLAIRDDESGAYVERRRCRAGQDILLLFPATTAQAWIDSADAGLFEDPPQYYRPSHGDDRPDREPLHGLPEDWLALRFKTRDDLSAVSLRGNWIGSVDRRATIRAEGGLILRRGIWMFGAGPRFRVVGPVSFDHLLIDGEPHALDAGRCTTPRLGVGEHRIRLPGQTTRGLRVRIAEPRRNALTRVEVKGWSRVKGGWPASAAERCRADSSSSGILHGARLEGDWPPIPRHEPPLVKTPGPPPADTMPDALAAMVLSVGRRIGPRRCPLWSRVHGSAEAKAMRTENPLLLGLLRVSHPDIRLGSGEA